MDFARKRYTGFDLWLPRKTSIKDIISPLIPHRRKYHGGHGGQGPSNTLIARYKFDEGSGTTVADSSVNGYTLAGTLGWNGSGKSGSGDAADFVAASTHGVDSNDSIVYNTNLITVCLWINVDITSGTYVLVESGGQFWNTPFPYSWAVYIDSNTLACGEQGEAVSPGSTRTESIPFTTTGSWVHIAAVFDNSGGSGEGDIKIFRDGIEQSTTSVTDARGAGGNFATQTLNVGVRDLAGAASGPQLYYDGLMDDLRIYEGELSEADIQNVMENPDE